MSYAKAMKHYNNPRKWKRTRTIDGRGMAASGRRGNALIFGAPSVQQGNNQLPQPALNPKGELCHTKTS